MFVRWLVLESVSVDFVLYLCDKSVVKLIKICGVIEEIKHADEMINMTPVYALHFILKV
jgi:hypothetical protein